MLNEPIESEISSFWRQPKIEVSNFSKGKKAKEEWIFFKTSNILHYVSNIPFSLFMLFLDSIKFVNVFISW